MFFILFNEKELDVKSNVQKMHIANSDKPVAFYSLDVIISVGYRVKSQRGTQFRRWANKVIKEYLLEGYVVNKKRLEVLEKTVKLIEIANRSDEMLKGTDAKNILRVIGSYSKALNILDDYDHRSLYVKRSVESKKKIDYEDCKKIINKLKYNEESEVFAIEKDNGLVSIINDIYQTFDGKEVYPSISEKAANFLYLIVKNHVFVDGNKRIAATLFIYFLQYYGMLFKDERQVIDNNTLVAITILIAESNPCEKDILANLVTNFL